MHGRRIRRATGVSTEVTEDPTVHPQWPRNGARAVRDPDGSGLIVLPAADP